MDVKANIAFMYTIYTNTKHKAQTSPKQAVVKNVKYVKSCGLRKDKVQHD